MQQLEAELLEMADGVTPRRPRLARSNTAQTRPRKVGSPSGEDDDFDQPAAVFEGPIGEAPVAQPFVVGQAGLPETV